MMLLIDFPPFRPHPLFPGGDAQTILGCYWTRKYPYFAHRHLVKLDDGDRIVLHDDCPASWSPGDRVALMIHGLGGSHLSPYMPRLAAKLNARGVRTFRMDLRGCGAGLHLARHAGHAGRSEDALAAVKYVERLCLGSPVTVVGVSMGGNIVLKMAGEVAHNPPPGLDRVAAVSPPIDIAACSRSMLKNRIYTRVFCKVLMKQVRRRRRQLIGLDSLPTVPAPRTLWEFDDRFTAPLSGFASAEDYYAQCSAAPLLERIAVPAVIIAAADDPVIPVGIFERAEISASTQLVVTRQGGHVGYVGAGGDDPDRRWLDWRVVDWIFAGPAGGLRPSPDDLVEPVRHRKEEEAASIPLSLNRKIRSTYR